MCNPEHCEGCQSEGKYTTSGCVPYPDDLRYHNARLQKEVATLRSALKGAMVVCDVAKQENEKLKSMLGFYGHISLADFPKRREGSI